MSACLSVYLYFCSPNCVSVCESRAPQIAASSALSPLVFDTSLIHVLSRWNARWPSRAANFPTQFFLYVHSPVSKVGPRALRRPGVRDSVSVACDGRENRWRQRMPSGAQPSTLHLSPPTEHQAFRTPRTRRFALSKSCASHSHRETSC